MKKQTKVTEHGKEEMFSANLSIFFLERHTDISFIGSFLKHKIDRGESKAMVPVTLLVISASVNRIVIFCKSKCAEQ